MGDVAAASSPVILDGAEYTGQPQKIVTELPAGMRYAISTEYINPEEIDASKIVPAGYTALDYIESTGTQAIDTGFSTTTGMVVKLAALWKSAPGYMVGSHNTGAPYGRNGVDIATHHNSSGTPCWELGFGNNFPISYSNCKVNTKYNLLVSTVSRNAYLDVDGERLITDNSAQSTYGGNIGLFCNNFARLRAGAATTKGYLNYAIIWNSTGKLVRDFVPVRRDDDDAVGMYDIYNNQFYNNAGTGEFVAGEVVNTAIKDLVWLDNVDDPRNEIVLGANTKYYVYYYTPNSDTTTVSQITVKDFVVKCNNHVYSDWQILTPVTCTTAGTLFHVCQGCGHAETIVVPTSGHEFVESINQPDCENRGYTQHVCQACGYIYLDNFVPAVGHSFGEWVTIEASSETVRQERYCEHDCSTKQTRILDPWLHQITINSTASDDLHLIVNIYSKQGTKFTLQDFVNYLNSSINDFACNGTVRYYDHASKTWCDAMVTRVVKYDSNSFAYYYLKNGIEIKVVTTLSWLNIDDQVSLWATVDAA